MATRTRLLKAIKANTSSQPINKKFLQDTMRAIEQYNSSSQRKSSEWYKPSGLHCMRGMYYTRTQTEKDKSVTEYNVSGMADTGTRRHEAIQEVLLKMKSWGYDWEYVDVEKYVKQQQKKGYCNSIVVKGKRGVETHLFDSNLNTSFMCDGIIKHIPTDTYYLFEFKNQTSFKFTKDTVTGERDGKSHIDLEHHNQVICYCTSLNLNSAFVMYENRDLLFLECPEVFEVTQEMKDNLVNYIMTCEGYVERRVPPPKPKRANCKYCDYKSTCRRDG